MTLKDTSELLEVLNKLPLRLQRISNISPIATNKQLKHSQSPRAHHQSGEGETEPPIIRLRDTTEIAKDNRRSIRSKRVSVIRPKVIKRKGNQALILNS